MSLDAKNNLQCQIDNITARLLLQEESTSLFESKLNKVHEIDTDLDNNRVSNKVGKQNSQIQNKSVHVFTQLEWGLHK